MKVWIGAGRTDGHLVKILWEFRQVCYKSPGIKLDVFWSTCGACLSDMAARVVTACICVCVWVSVWGCGGGGGGRGCMCALASQEGTEGKLKEEEAGGKGRRKSVREGESGKRAEKAERRRLEGV